MFVAAIHNGWFVAPSHQDVTLRAVALVIMAVGIGLTFLSPAFFRGRYRVGPARMGVGLLAVLTGAGIWSLAAVVALFFPHAAGDELSVEGALVLASLLMLFGAIFVRNVTREEVDSEFNYGILLAWPAFACMVVDSVGLGYLWLGAQSAGGATRHSGLYLAGATLLVALALLAEALQVMRTARRLPVFFGRALGAAAPAALAEVLFVVVRGSSDWYSGTRLAGFDLMFGAIVLAVATFIVVVSRTGEEAHVKRMAVVNAIRRGPAPIAEKAETPPEVDVHERYPSPLAALAAAE